MSDIGADVVNLSDRMDKLEERLLKMERLLISSLFKIDNILNDIKDNNVTIVKNIGLQFFTEHPEQECYKLIPLSSGNPPFCLFLLNSQKEETILNDVEEKFKQELIRCIAENELKVGEVYYFIIYEIE